MSDLLSGGAPTVVIVGFTLAMRAALEKFMPENSILFIDEPDVVRKRQTRTKIGVPQVRGLVEWEYHLPGTADEFYLTYPDLNVTAVLPGIEYSVPFAARLAERYGVPGATLGAAEILRDKALLRRVSRAGDIANPECQEVADVEQARRFMRGIGGPVVLKPANRQASVGTYIVHDIDALDAAWAQAVQQDEGPFVPDRPIPLRMLAERYVSGEEFSVEMLLRDGEPLFGNVTGKVLHPGPRPVEAGHLVPAPIPEAQTDLLLTETHRMLAQLGFGTGFVHCEWIVADGTPYLVECAGRMPGDGIIDLIENAYPVDIVRDYFDVMQGRPLAGDLPTRAARGAAVWFLVAEPGEVVSVDGVEAAREVPGVLACDVVVHAGERVQQLRSSWDRVAIVTTAADTAVEALANAREAVGRISVKVLVDPS